MMRLWRALAGLLAFGVGSGRARTVLFNASGVLLDDPSSYTPQLGSPQNYPSITGQVLLIDTICDSSVAIPSGAIIAFSSYNCDVGKTLIFLRAAGVPAAIELYGAHQSQEPYDKPPRFAYNPNPPIIMNRVHGSNSALMYQMLLNSTNISATLEFTTSPWKNLYISWAWNIFYEGLLLGFYVVLLIPHAVYGLWLIRQQKKRSVHDAFQIDLPETLMYFSLALGVMYLCSEVGSMVRELGEVWVPEAFLLLVYIYSYIIQLLSVLILILYWSDLLNSTAVRIGNVQKVNLRIFAGVSLIAFVIGTGVVLYYVYRYPDWEIVWDVLYGVLGAFSFCMALFAILYGWRIVRLLRFTGPVVNRPIDPSVVPPTHFSTSLMSSSQQGETAPKDRRGSMPGRGSVASLEISEIEARARRAALKKARPMTRLVVVTGTVLLIICGLALAGALSPVQYTIPTYFATLEAVAIFTVILYGLIIFTVSPVLSEARKRRRMRKAKPSPRGSMEPLSEDEADRARRCCGVCWKLERFRKQLWDEMDDL